MTVKAENYYFCTSSGMLAQLVQSIALTGRGSLVRVQYIPHKSPDYQGFFFSDHDNKNKEVIPARITSFVFDSASLEITLRKSLPL